MHLKRWLTGLIALPFLIFLIYKGGIWFLVLIFGGCALALWEYFRIVLDEAASILSAMTIIAMTAGLLLIWIAYRGAHELTIVVLAADLMAATYSEMLVDMDLLRDLDLYEDFEIIAQLEMEGRALGGEP